MSSMFKKMVGLLSVCFLQAASAATVEEARAQALSAYSHFLVDPQFTNAWVRWPVASELCEMRFLQKTTSAEA